MELLENELEPNANAGIHPGILIKFVRILREGLLVENYFSVGW